jgi:agmatine deiminase
MTKHAAKTPAQLGYSMPPEWAPHRATWISWPRPEGISFPDGYHTIPANIAAIIREIVPRELVCINVPNENYERIVREQLVAGGVPAAAVQRRVKFHLIKTNECWCRDHGPAFVIKRGGGAGRRKAVVDWGFNAWGGKYPPYDADDAVPTRVAEHYGLRAFDAPIVMEGGSVDFDGRGTILTTTQCLLNKNRNPGVPKATIERHLCDYYGQQRVLWLGDGIEGDDTDGHIDDLARFVDPRTIVIGMEPDPKDPNHRVLRDNRRRLDSFRDADGKPYTIVELPMPGRIVREGQRLPATYMNFYFINGALLVPTFGHRRNDRLALDTLARLLPKRKVIGVDCRELIWGLGAIHCLTQQEPR